MSGSINAELHWTPRGLRVYGQSFTETFNGRFLEEYLNAHWFLTLADAQQQDTWRRYYNE